MDGELTLEFLGRIGAALGHGDPRDRDKLLLAVVMDAYAVGLDEGRSHGEVLVRGLGEALRAQPVQERFRRILNPEALQAQPPGKAEPVDLTPKITHEDAPEKRNPTWVDPAGGLRAPLWAFAPDANEDAPAIPEEDEGAGEADG